MDHHQQQQQYQAGLIGNNVPLVDFPISAPSPMPYGIYPPPLAYNDGMMHHAANFQAPLMPYPPYQNPTSFQMAMFQHQMLQPLPQMMNPIDLYQGDGRRSKKEKKIPRAMNAYMLFSQDKRKSCAEPGTPNGERSKILSKLWAEMSSEEKAPYDQEALRLKLEHKIKYPHYVYKPQSKATKEAEKQRIEEERLEKKAEKEKAKEDAKQKRLAKRLRNQRYAAGKPAEVNTANQPAPQQLQPMPDPAFVVRQVNVQDQQQAKRLPDPPMQRPIPSGNLPAQPGFKNTSPQPGPQQFYRPQMNYQPAPQNVIQYNVHNYAPQPQQQQQHQQQPQDRQLPPPQATQQQAPSPNYSPPNTSQLAHAPQAQVAHSSPSFNPHPAPQPLPVTSASQPRQQPESVTLKRINDTSTAPIHSPVQSTSQDSFNLPNISIPPSPNSPSRLQHSIEDVDNILENFLAGMRNAEKTDTSKPPPNPLPLNDLTNNSNIPPSLNYQSPVIPTNHLAQSPTSNVSSNVVHNSSLNSPFEGSHHFTNHTSHLSSTQQPQFNQNSHQSHSQTPQFSTRPPPIPRHQVPINTRPAPYNINNFQHNSKYSPITTQKHQSPNLHSFLSPKAQYFTPQLSSTNLLHQNASLYPTPPSDCDENVSPITHSFPQSGNSYSNVSHSHIETPKLVPKPRHPFVNDPNDISLF